MSNPWRKASSLDLQPFCDRHAFVENLIRAIRRFDLPGNQGWKRQSCLSHRGLQEGNLGNTQFRPRCSLLRSSFFCFKNSTHGREWEQMKFKELTSCLSEDVKPSPDMVSHFGKTFPTTGCLLDKNGQLLVAWAPKVHMGSHGMPAVKKCFKTMDPQAQSPKVLQGAESLVPNDWLKKIFMTSSGPLYLRLDKSVFGDKSQKRYRSSNITLQNFWANNRPYPKAESVLSDFCSNLQKIFAQATLHRLQSPLLVHDIHRRPLSPCSIWWQKMPIRNAME